MTSKEQDAARVAREDRSGAEAGLELDLLIEEHVMGSTWQGGILYRAGKNWCYGARDESGRTDRGICPHYSSDIAAAWQVVEEMRRRHFSLCLGLNAFASVQNGVKFYNGVRGLGHSLFNADPHPDPYAVADTVPLAICRAALAALEAA